MATQNASLGYVAPYLMRDDRLDEALKEARSKVAELEQERRNREQWPKEMQLAIRLHDHFCRSRDCDFNYQFGKDGLQGSSNLAEPREYMAMAARVTAFCEAHHCKPEDFIQVLEREEER